MTRKIAFFSLLLATLCLNGIAAEEFPDSDIQWILDQYQISESVSLIPATGFDGWTRTGGGRIPAQSKWSNKEGTFVLNFSDDTKNFSGGDIVTAKQYTNFVFDFSWIGAKGCNSGVKYRFKRFVNDENKTSSWLGYEYQILDDFNKSEGNSGDGRWSTASLYDMIAPDKTKKKLKPFGERNTGRIIVLDNHIEHWLNGEKVVEYEVGSDVWKKALEQSKYPTLDVKPAGFGENPTGFIMLQDHGGSITFSTIKIREIGEKKERKASDSTE